MEKMQYCGCTVLITYGWNICLIKDYLYYTASPAQKCKQWKLK